MWYFLKLFLLVAVVMIVLSIVILYLCQGKFIYIPRSYPQQPAALKYTEPLGFESRGKQQIVFLMNRSDDEKPKRVTWFFSGNGSVALNWVELLRRADSNAGHVFILFDYPGYGFNRGRPHPDTIAQSVDDALPAVADKLGLTVDELISRSGAVGHSLGAAVAFDTANRHGFSRVVAISPFTSMRSMAERQMGRVVVPLLRHHYENEEAIDGLLASDTLARIDIYHGDADRLIPMSMGKSLQERDSSGKRVFFHRVPSAGHNDIILHIGDELIRKLNDSAAGEAQ